MKKKFQKISRIVFIAGILALLALIIIVANTSATSDGTIDGGLGFLTLACIIVMLVTGILAVINCILAFVEGIKKNRKGFLKRFGVQFLVMVFIYMFLHFTSDVKKEFDILELVLRSLIMSAGIMGGEYMIAPPKDEEEELHF